jgi:hypothetical protein
MVIRNNVHTEDPQILGATVQSRPGYLAPGRCALLIIFVFDYVDSRWINLGKKKMLVARTRNVAVMPL